MKPESDRLYQIALRVEDAEAVRAHLAAHGYEKMLPATVPVGQMKNANFTVRAPHNYTIEIVQYMPDGRTMLDRGKFLPDSRISHHIAHAGAVVDDPEVARHFYGELFGFKESWRGSMDGRELSWIHMKMQASPDFVEWMLNPKVDPHFCLEVADVEAAKAKLEKTDYAATYATNGRPIETKIGKNHRRQLNLWDPEGVRVELMEPNTFDGQPVTASEAPLPPLSPRP